MTFNTRQLLVRVGLCGICQNNQNHTNILRVKSGQRQSGLAQALSWHGHRQNIWQQNNAETLSCLSSTCMPPSACPNTPVLLSWPLLQSCCHGPCHQQESRVWLPASPGIPAIAPQGSGCDASWEPELMENWPLQLGQQQFSLAGREIKEELWVICSVLSCESGVMAVAAVAEDVAAQNKNQNKNHCSRIKIFNPEEVD